MAKKAFDLMPPYPQPKKYHHHESKAKKEEKKSRKTFLFFVFGLFFLGLFYFLMKLGNDSIVNQSTNQAGSSSSTDSSKFELFSNNGESNLTDQQNPIIVRLANGDSLNNARIAKDLLLNAGFEIEKTETAVKASEQTVIYYKKGHRADAQTAANALASNFSAQLQESTNLESSYDLLITVGQK